MSELQVIHSALERAGQRRRRASALRGLWQGLFVGAIFSLILVILWHFPLGWPSWLHWAAVAAPFPCMLAGLLIGGWRKPALDEVARWVDGRKHLQERLSTALEVSAAPKGDAWRGLVVTDAAEHAKLLDIRSLLPFHLPNVTRWALALLALAVGLGFVPEYQTKHTLQRARETAHINEIGRRLAELTRRNLTNRPPVFEQTEKTVESVAQTAERWMDHGLTRNDALKDLANAAQKVKDQFNNLAQKDAALKNLKRYDDSQRTAGANDPHLAAQMQQKIDELQKQLGSASSNNLSQVQTNLSHLQQAAQALADKGENATQGDRQQLSNSLQALGAEMQQMGLSLPQLEAAMQALATNSPGLAMNDLKAATTDLQKMQQMVKNLQQLQQDMQQMGKNLAEQLQNGQPQAAQQTLQKMAQQLQTGGLTPQQFQQVMNDVANAVDPAKDYGTVSDQLRQALQQMKDAANQMQNGQNGQQPGQNSAQGQAAQSLQAAADQLGNLMQQMAGDAQSLQAELAALGQASSAISSGQGWNAARGGAGHGRGTGKGGKPGSGVGDWGDDNARWDGEASENWDNSGINRPDQAPRPPTERDAELSEALRPTSVPGQFSPGAPMPSLPLKGVSIRGTSEAQYVKAAAAAQSDAQAALSQDRVPRAYAGAVRDYFTEMEK